MMKHSQALVRRAVIATTAVALGLFAVVVNPQPAGATVQGDCIATINHITASQNFTSDNAIEVFEHSGVDVFMQMNSPVHRRLTYLSFGVGPSVLVGDETDPTSSTTTINVDQYATYGIGLYRVDATATSISGQTCRVSALVKVDGNPETTVAGGAATGAEVLALLGIAGAGVRAANPGEAGTGTGPGSGQDSSDDSSDDDLDDVALGLSMYGFCALATLPALLLTSAAMVGGGTPSGAPIRLRRIHWRPRFSIVGMASGVIGGLAAVVLLQQSGRLFPSYEILGRALVVGLLAGILIPSLTRLIAVRRANRRVAARERAINAAVTRSATPAAAPVTDAPSAAPPAAQPPVVAPPAPGAVPGSSPWVATHRSTAADSPLRVQPDAAAEPTSQLGGGTALRVLEESGPWSRVQSADGREGWVESSQLERMT
jgi:Bacterial SH3 domain